MMRVKLTSCTPPVLLVCFLSRDRPLSRRLKKTVVHALETNKPKGLVFDAYKGDNAMLAVMKDVVEEMATLTGRTVAWEGALPTVQSSLRLTSEDIEAAYGTPDIFLCASSLDAHSDARVLRSELAIAHGRACAVGGGEFDAGKVLDKCRLFVVLLTKQMLADPVVLFEIWEALQRNMTIVPVMVSGAGYDYGQANETYSDLKAALDKAWPGATQKLQDKLPANMNEYMTVARRWARSYMLL